MFFAAQRLKFCLSPVKRPAILLVVLLGQLPRGRTTQFMNVTHTHLLRGVALAVCLAWFAGCSKPPAPPIEIATPTPEPTPTPKSTPVAKATINNALWTSETRANEVGISRLGSGDAPLVRDMLELEVSAVFSYPGTYQTHKCRGRGETFRKDLTIAELFDGSDP